MFRRNGCSLIIYREHIHHFYPMWRNYVVLCEIIHANSAWSLSWMVSTEWKQTVKSDKVYFLISHSYRYIQFVVFQITVSCRCAAYSRLHFATTSFCHVLFTILTKESDLTIPISYMSLFSRCVYLFLSVVCVSWVYESSIGVQISWAYMVP